LCSALIQRLPVGVLSRREIAADLIGKRIDFPIGVGDVPGGDCEGRDELRQPEQEPDSDSAEHRRRHELMGIIVKQDIGKVPEEEGDPERKDETALGRLESLG